MPGPTVFFVALNKIHRSESGREPAVFLSPYLEKVRENAQQILKRQEWKSGVPTPLQNTSCAACAPESTVTGISAGRAEGELLYSFLSESVSGILSHDLKTGAERRLWHGNDRKLVTLHASPGNPKILCSMMNQDGSADVVSVEETSRAINFNTLTSGESVDLAPSWVEGSDERLVFHSFGIGRDQHGMLAGYAPSAVQELNWKTGVLKTVLEDPKLDFLFPRMRADGTLYCLRKPYRQSQRPTFLATLKNVLLFPYYLLVGLFHFLNFFTMASRGKPLSDDGRGDVRFIDPFENLIRGNMNLAMRPSGKAAVDKFLKEAAMDFIKRGPNGEITLLKSGVTQFDVARDGRVYVVEGEQLLELDGAKAVATGARFTRYFTVCE